MFKRHEAPQRFAWIAKLSRWAQVESTIGTANWRPEHEFKEAATGVAASFYL